MATRTTRFDRVLPLLLVFLAIGQAVATLAFDLLAQGELTSGAAVSALVPPEGWFAIWGLVITLTIAWSVASYRRSVRHDPTRMLAGRGLAVTYAGFSAWMAAASTGQSTPATMPVLAIMTLGLVWAARVVTVRREEIRGWPRWDRALGSAVIGIYLGWTSMATWVNLATIVQGAGAPADGTWGTIWQAGVLALAAGTAVGLIVLTRGMLPYAVTVVYALAGIAVSTAAAGFPALSVLAVVAAVLAVVSTIVIRISDRARTARVLVHGRA